MLVRELVAALQALDPELPVYIGDGEREELMSEANEEPRGPRFRALPADDPPRRVVIS